MTERSQNETIHKRAREKNRARRLAAFVMGLWFVLLQFFDASLPVQAQVEISAPSAILMEASTGQVIFELNATERRCPASITKIMTLLLTFEQIENGKISLSEIGRAHV